MWNSEFGRKEAQYKIDLQQGGKQMASDDIYTTLFSEYFPNFSYSKIHTKINFQIKEFL